MTIRPIVCTIFPHLVSFFLNLTLFCGILYDFFLYALDIAGGFKQQGNDYFKGKRYREALGFYNQAIDAKPDDKALLESLFLNRAACNLELREYIILPTFLIPLFPSIRCLYA